MDELTESQNKPLIELVKYQKSQKTDVTFISVSNRISGGGLDKDIPCDLATIAIWERFGFIQRPEVGSSLFVLTNHGRKYAEFMAKPGFLRWSILRIRSLATNGGTILREIIIAATVYLILEFLKSIIE